MSRRTVHARRNPAPPAPREPVVRVLSAVAEPRVPLLERVRRRIDLPLVVALLLVAGTVLWSVQPRATAATASSDTSVAVTTNSNLAVVPGFTRGDSHVSLGDLSAPGQQRDVSSDGWVMTTNWIIGYTVMVRSTTDPAMRGMNAVDQRGSSDNFKDFTLSGCPCPWDIDGFGKGVFGYSASIAKVSGPDPTDTAKWGSSSSRKWRGFDDTDYTLYQTPGGTGKYSMTLYFRTGIPEDGVQRAGSYRATAIVSVHANI